jgi:hypothetical protein
MATQAFCSEKFLDLGMSRDVVVFASIDAVLAAFMLVMKSFEATQCQAIENEASQLAAHAAALAALKAAAESTANAAKQVSPWAWALGGLVVVGLITPWPGDEVVALAGLGLFAL